jgi:hypothetical protein
VVGWASDALGCDWTGWLKWGGEEGGGGGDGDRGVGVGVGGGEELICKNFLYMGYDLQKYDAIKEKKEKIKEHKS